MTVKELMKKAALRNRLSDYMETGYDDDELIAYLNDAINFIWNVLIDNDYYEVIGDVTFTNTGESVPDDFYKVTNQAPIIIKKGKVELYADKPQVVRYYRKPQFVTSIDDEIPFTNEGFSNIIAQLVVIFAMSNHGFNMDVEQDTVEAIVRLL